jgi:type II secretory pathway pseudopilin PulG
MKKYRSGQSMIELLLAIAVMVIMLASTAGVMSVTEKRVEEMTREAQALALAEEGVQATISIADRSWSDLTAGQHGLAVGSSPVMWVFQGISDSNGDYTRTLTVTSEDQDTKKVVIVVTWHPAPGRTATIEEELVLTDWAFI